MAAQALVPIGQATVLSKRSDRQPLNEAPSQHRGPRCCLPRYPAVTVELIQSGDPSGLVGDGPT
jgi:hypothetical protein